MESVYVPTFQQGGGPGFEHTAPQPAAAATPTEAGAREHRFSPYSYGFADRPETISHHSIRSSAVCRTTTTRLAFPSIGLPDLLAER